MADKPISELVKASQITATDLLVLQQDGTAKCLPGQVLLNWLTAAADGHGGIQSIEKVSTSGLADTYRITLADTATFDFVVTNGRSVSSITKTKTSGLVDTYTITYNDSTSGTFTVTNGAKGATGAAAYVWIKYASQEPTAASHSFGDVPDKWMGVYSGTASSAPTDWSQYKWFRIRGDQGETGDPATLSSAAVTYQVGDSGTVIPSGTWSASLPVVPQGKFLWTRQVIQFNTGEPVTSYSVARFGVDGAGSVSSVNNLGPDENGNVTVSAASLGALPLAGGTMAGPVNMNGQAVTGLNPPTSGADAASKEYVDAIDWFGQGKSIPQGSDLDAYKTAGKYYAQTESLAKSLANCPTKTNFVLFVFLRTNNVYSQLIMTLHGEMFLRSSSTSAWREWVEFANMSDIATALQEAKDSGEFTPVKGVDYWTEEDQEAIVQQVITALGTPVFGTVDENKVITLTGDLADGTYTLKYEGSDGSKLSIGTVTIGETINQISISTDENGAVFNAVGYQSGYRINSSGSVTENSCYTITGFIPFTQTDILRISADAFAGADDGGYNSVAVFDPDKTFLGNVYADALSVESDTVYALDVSDRSTFADAAFVRITGNGITADTVATVNQPID